jgi:methylmalonyl-CoA decarboxylase subunit alpha
VTQEGKEGEPLSIEEKIETLKKKLEQAKQGGGLKRIEKQHQIGKLTARERLDLLLDPGSFEELGMFITHQSTAFGMEENKFYGDGVITGSGLVNGRRVYVFAQDFTVMGGSLGEQHAKKICAIMDKAIEVGSPMIGLIDSGGARIQEGLGHYGSIFFRNVLAAGVVPQISVILGPCAGGAVYSPALSDFVFMVKNISQMHITGPKVIKEVTGESITAEWLGGAKVHSEKSGVVHFTSNTEIECMDYVKRLLSFLPSNNREIPPVIDSHDVTDREEDKLAELIPEDPKRPYDMRQVIRLVGDNKEFFEVMEQYAKNILIGFIRLNGRPTGVIANQPMVFAGCLDINASDKAARFIRFCDTFNFPIITFIDCPGYLPGVEQEHGGIIRHGAKMLYAYCEATVPRISIIVRKIYGGAMSGMSASKLVGTDLTAALPTAEIAIMGPEAAAQIIFKEEIEKATDKKDMMNQKVKEYREKFANPYLAAEKGWLDAIIEPKKIRPYLIRSLDQLTGKKVIRPYRKHGTIPL